MSTVSLLDDSVAYYAGVEDTSASRTWLPLPWKFAIGATAGAVLLLGSCLMTEVTKSLYVVSQPAATMRAVPMATKMVRWAAPSGAVDEDEVSAKAVAAAVEEEKPNPKDFYMGQDSYYPKLRDTLAVNKKWYVIDAANLRLGRMCTEIANILRGKGKATFHPAMDMGDYVVVVNAEKVLVSGRKAEQKLYRRHVTGRPGSLKEETFQDLQKRLPQRIIEHAVKGMLPKGPLGRSLFTHLKVYKGPSHPHEAQQPIEVKFEGPLGRAAEPLGRR